MNFFFRLSYRDKIAFINLKFKTVFLKPFTYINCVVFSLFKVASSSAEREKRERERRREREREYGEREYGEREYGVLSSAELAISILSISISFYLFCFSVVFRFDL